MSYLVIRVHGWNGWKGGREWVTCQLPGNHSCVFVVLVPWYNFWSNPDFRFSTFGIRSEKLTNMYPDFDKHVFSSMIFEVIWRLHPRTITHLQNGICCKGILIQHNGPHCEDYSAPIITPNYRGRYIRVTEQHTMVTEPNPPDPCVTMCLIHRDSKTAYHGNQTQPDPTVIQRYIEIQNHLPW